MLLDDWSSFGLRGSALIIWTVYLLVALRLYVASAGAMRIVLQRVKSASVTVEQKVISSIGPGVSLKKRGFFLHSFHRFLVWIRIH